MGTKKKRQLQRRYRGKKAQGKVVLEPDLVKRNNVGIFGFMARRMKIFGDVESPLSDWEYQNPAKNLEE